MAPVIKRIIIFLFSLLIIVLLLAGAAKGEDTLRFDLLNSKEIIKQELPLDSRSSRMIVNQVEEYPKRTFIFDPIVIFDDYDEVMICGQELTMIDFTGTRIVVSIYSALFPNDKSIQNLIRLEAMQVTPLNEDYSFEEMDKLELYPYGMNIIKNNKELTSIERGDKTDKSFVRGTNQNFMKDKAYVLKEFYMGNYDLHFELFKGNPSHIPVPSNRYYLTRKIEMIDHCLLELKKNENRANLPKGEIYEEAYHRTG